MCYVERTTSIALYERISAPNSEAIWSYFYATSSSALHERILSPAVGWAYVGMGRTHTAFG